MSEKKTYKTKKPKAISKKERKRRADNLREKNEIRLRVKREEQMVLNKHMPLQHKMFCDLYIFGSYGMIGNHKECYIKVFKDEKNAAAKGRALLNKEHIIKYIEKKRSECEFLLQAEKYKNIQTLAKIRDEMADAEYINRFGETNGVAACRAVSLKAAKDLNEMLGFDKPKEINVNHNNENMGVTINVIAPTPAPPQKELDGGTIDIDCEEV